jgi:hypothetical protein
MNGALFQAGRLKKTHTIQRSGGAISRPCYHIQWQIADTERVARAGWNTDVFLALAGDKAKDFVTAQTGEQVHLPNLEGVSGAGMWVRSASTAPWSLAGIVVEDHPSKRMLKVIKVEHVWTPLDRFCEQLATGRVNAGLQRRLSSPMHRVPGPERQL